MSIYVEYRWGMSQIAQFLSNPIVGLVGYVLSAVAALIAIQQFFSARKVRRELVKLNFELNTLRLENSKIIIENRNRVEQGDRSQYFQENSGPIHIDNRG